MVSKSALRKMIAGKACENRWGGVPDRRDTLPPFEGGLRHSSAGSQSKPLDGPLCMYSERCGYYDDRSCEPVACDQDVTLQNEECIAFSDLIRS